MGPMVDRRHVRDVTRFIETAKAEGTEVLFEGSVNQSRGQYLAPIIFVNPDPKSAIYREEVFGPVLVVLDGAKLAEQEEDLGYDDTREILG